MYFLLSGEGQTDLGRCSDNSNNCGGNQHERGPMAIIASQIAEEKIYYPFVDSGDCYGYVSKAELAERARELKKKKKPLILSGKKRPKETTFFYKNARVLAMCAMEVETEKNDTVVAIFFRDSDGTASTGRGLWQAKWDSMIKGFCDEGFERGVPMMPKPKSEAWLLCALKKLPYQQCDNLEQRSGNDNSPNSLKEELNVLLEGQTSRTDLCELVTDLRVDSSKITMPSFLAFKTALQQALDNA